MDQATFMRRLACFGAAAAVSGAGLAQSYPNKPIHVIIPYSPGATDTSLRVFTGPIEKELGQPLVFDYKPGAAGSVGQLALTKSAPDGYTLLASTSNPWVFIPALKKTKPYDPVKDFTPVTLVAEYNQALVARADFPANNLSELVAYAKANPGKVSFGTSGIGSGQHMAGEILNRLAGIQMLHVPYQGMTAVVNAMMSNQVPLTINVVQVVKAQVQAGNLKYIASAESSRVPTLPASLGLIKDVYPEFPTMPNWLAFAAPAGLPEPILQRLNTVIVKAIKAPDVVAKYSNDFGATIVGNTPQEFAARIRSDFDIVTRAVKTAGVPLED